MEIKYMILEVWGLLKQQTTILFQGDSITDGSRGREVDTNYNLGFSYPTLIGAELAYTHAERRPVIINR